MVEFAALHNSILHLGFFCVGRWSPQQKDYIEIKGEAYPTFEEAVERAHQLNMENQDEHDN